MKKKKEAARELEGDVKGSVSPYVKKKMGGGMMNKPMGYDQGAPKGGIDVKKQAARPFTKKTKFDPRKLTFIVGEDGKRKELSLDELGKFYKGENFSKGGSSVMARGCKLGRKKATKLT